ncbi:baseplate multidomain protein megatron [Oceaniglobus ichthyenteri]|uniref:baseplate multidomain protein megatron n=1 Tax=Oceaniglobus ichthyenteri TaxID=2136177 RepID=UPI000D3ADA42|nr:glycoside hydrolase/phage tail family protein [Oceaniglobus ichthyenteri]
MATIVLSALGAAAGASLGGGVLGLSSVVIGRAIGATLGRVIDQSILGAGSQAVETGKVERFRLTGASEGTPINQIFGRTRVSGQVIWSTQFQEKTTTSGSGKGMPSGPSTTAYSYSISVAIALCEGEISRIGRVWVDGAEASLDDFNIRIYPGSEDQLPDPKIEAVEGTGNVPAYRGIAYVVFEDLELGAYGNRVPQFSFEVVRPEPAAQSQVGAADLAGGIQGVAMMPGTGEYALATTPVRFEKEPGVSTFANVNSPLGKTDFAASVDALQGELPNCQTTSLIVSWFGNDLRCGECDIAPKVEQVEFDGVEMPWTVSGISRSNAQALAKVDGNVVYGGTPSDQSIKEAIIALRDAGQDVMFYPFILMEQLGGNGLADPYSDADDQPVLPWRGRITTSVAPGRAGTPDKTAQAAAEVAAFFGQAQPGDFTVTDQGVDYTGPSEFSYRRFILHYAHLCASVPGGVHSFCIGSEMRGLTQIRGAANSFPAVAAMVQLAGEVRAILGPDCKIGYASDWSEYFGYHPQDGSGEVFFHLDPLWADPAIDFIGIDNYMPLADWRDGFDHADADWGSIYRLDYLQSNIAGGEGYDWYYHAPDAEAIQRRTPITDGAYNEPWVFRYKDLRNWWSRDHYDRPGGVRSATPTAWVPGSKPIWFTEYGCAVIDKGANQPNKFLDPKSSESSLPKFSTGRRDDLMQMQYLRAMADYWATPANNPVSDEFGVQMVDMTRGMVWAWDARPFPYFPGNSTLWDDADNYARGHWITGRATSRALSSVVREICALSGVHDVDVSRLFDVVRGYVIGDSSGARQRLQPLMLAYGFDAVERNGTLIFQSRDGREIAQIDPATVAVSEDVEGDIDAIRNPEADSVGRLRLNFVSAEGNFDVQAAEAIFPDERSFAVSQSEIPLVLTRAEATGIVERWLAESRVARDRLKFSLPMSKLHLGAGDVVRVKNGLYRVDHVEQAGQQILEAVRIEPELYQPSDSVDATVRLAPFVAPVPVLPVFLDLPLITGSEVAHAPHIAVMGRPWPGSVAVYDSALEDGFVLNKLISAQATVGVTQSTLFSAPAGLIDNGAPVRVRLLGGALDSVTMARLLAGANAMAIGTGYDDIWEVFQFGQANLVGERTYDLTQRLRGQLGTDALMPQEWPIGSRVVLLNNAIEQIGLDASNRGLARYYRIGPAGRPLDDPIYSEQQRAFDGIGLRPYAPVHLRLNQQGGGIQASWIRRTRYEGDAWGDTDVPLNETTESYVVRVVKNGGVVRTHTVTSPSWTYSAQQQTSDGITAPFAIEVAQISDRFGPGLYRRAAWLG